MISWSNMYWLSVVLYIWDFDVKDNLSLIAAAAGGFMLFVALTGILRGTPLVSWQSYSSFYRPIDDQRQPYATPVQAEALWETKNIFNQNIFDNNLDKNTFNK